MGEEPTKEQIREFWEWCGFEFDERWSEFNPYKDHNGVIQHSRTPIDLNNLFKYAVPKVIEKLDKQSVRFECFYRFIENEWVWVYWITDDLDHITHAIDEDPALALYWALDKAMKEQGK